MKRTLWLLSVVLLLSACLPTRAEDSAVLQLLKQPGVHAIMRHALAPGTGDPAAFKLDDCSTQRNLDESGREQARAVGAALKTAGIAFDRVLTSQWCRCRETAQLLNLGTPQDLDGLNSFFQDRSTAKAQTEQVRKLLAGLGPDERVMLVTHQVNISALTGRWISSGEVFAIRMGADGTVEVLGQFLLPAG